MHHLREKIARFMYGRYGMDELGRDLLKLMLVLIVLSFLMKSSLLNWFVWFLLFYQYYRMFSRNHAKRCAENQAYLKIRNKWMYKFRQWKANAGDKTHRIFHCPSCGQKVRVPRGKGKISIHCPKCNTDFVKRS